MIGAWLSFCHFGMREFVRTGTCGKNPAVTGSPVLTMARGRFGLRFFHRARQGAPRRGNEFAALSTENTISIWAGLYVSQTHSV